MNKVIINNISNINPLNDIFIQVCSNLALIIIVSLILIIIKLFLPHDAWKFLMELKKDIFT